MYRLTDNDCKLIKDYKKTKSEDIALYFFDKYRSDVIDLVYYKINRKFSSIPFEKGDLFYLLWKSIEKSLSEFKNKENFNGILINNCYLLTIKEIRKFLNNHEMVMNVSSSFESQLNKKFGMVGKNSVCGIETPRSVLLRDIVSDACFYIKKYKTTTIKNVVYLKSIGNSVGEICKILKISRHYVEDILNSIEKIVKKIYF